MTNSIRSIAIPADIVSSIVYSNEDPSKSVDLKEGIVRIWYYESILQDTVRATVVYSDSGNTIEKDGKKVSAVEGLPIVGQERFELTFADRYDEPDYSGDDTPRTEISFTKEDDNSLYVNKITPIIDDTTKSLVMLDLVSKEYLLNEKMRLNTRFDGKISDHVKGILTKSKSDKDGTKSIEKN